MEKYIKKMKTVSVCLLVGTMMLLVTQSMIPVVTADYAVPQNIHEGDIVLIQWGDKENLPWGLLFHKYLYWDHAMLYTDAVDDRVIHAWAGVQDLDWNTAMGYNDQYGGVEKLGLVRVTNNEDVIQNAEAFAEDKVGHPYDVDSQKILNPRKQIQPDPEDWWYDVLPSSWVTRFSDNTNGRADKYYCTELVWAAYFNATLGQDYLEFSPDRYAIRGMEIWLDADGTQINPTPYDVGNPQPMLYDEC